MSYHFIKLWLFISLLFLERNDRINCLFLVFSILISSRLNYAIIIPLNIIQVLLLIHTLCTHTSVPHYIIILNNISNTFLKIYHTVWHIISIYTLINIYYSIHLSYIINIRKQQIRFLSSNFMMLVWIDFIIPKIKIINTSFPITFDAAVICFNN
jgi:hypothetical protein